MTVIRKLAATLCLTTLILALPACSNDNGDDAGKKDGNGGDKTSANGDGNGGANGNGNGDGDRTALNTITNRTGDRPTSLTTANGQGSTQPQKQPGRPEQYIVKMDIDEMDIGEIPCGEKKKKTVRLTNTGDEPMKVIKCQSSCACTTSNCPTGKIIPAGESVDIVIELKAGLLPGIAINKKMTFIIEGQPNLVLPVKGVSYSAVSVNPNRLDSTTNPEGRIELVAADGQPFSILSMTPIGIGDYSNEAKTEHTIVLGDGWCDKFIEARSTKFTISIDHPEARQVQGTIIGECATAVIKAIQDNAANRSRPDTGLLNLARSGNIEGLTKALETASNVDPRDNTGASPLVLAAQNGHLECVKLLVDKGANIEGVTDFLLQIKDLTRMTGSEKSAASYTFPQILTDASEFDDVHIGARGAPPLAAPGE